jgi:hypothetical protein
VIDRGLASDPVDDFRLGLDVRKDVSHQHPSVQERFDTFDFAEFHRAVQQGGAPETDVSIGHVGECPIHQRGILHDEFTEFPGVPAMNGQNRRRHFRRHVGAVSEQDVDHPMFAFVTAAHVGAQHAIQRTHVSVFRLDTPERHIRAGLDEVLKSGGLQTFPGSKNDWTVVAAVLTVRIRAVLQQKVRHGFPVRPAPLFAIPKRMGQRLVEVMRGEITGGENFPDKRKICGPGRLGKRLEFHLHIRELIRAACHGLDHLRELRPVLAAVFARELKVRLRELEGGLEFDPALGLLLQVFEAGVHRQLFARCRRGGVASVGSVHENPFFVAPAVRESGKETVRCMGLVQVG